jgi:hypothetical protein
VNGLKQHIINILLLFIPLALTTCGDIPVEQTEKAADAVAKREPAAWVYFSQSTFPGNNFREGMKTPNVRRKLTAQECLLLDSVIAGHFNPPPDSAGYRKAGCYWPKHAVEVVTENSNSGINICFQCNSTHSSDPGLAAVSMEAWKTFFTRIGIPAGDGYPEFFSKAHNDSIFRQQNGIFQF